MAETTQEQNNLIQAMFHRPLRALVLTSDAEWGGDLVGAYRLHSAVRFRPPTAQPEQLDEVLRVEGADLVVVDNELVGADSGLEVAARIVQRYPKIGVYLASAAATMALHNAAVTRGIRSVIAKPFAPEELVAVVSSVLVQERAVEARLQGSPGDRAPVVRRGASPAVSQVVAVGGGKGGSGKSQISVNLAVLLQTNPVANIAAALIDLERNEGAIPYLLGENIGKQHTVVDWLPYVPEDGGAVDPGLVRERLLMDLNGLDLVLNPNSVTEYDMLDEPTVKAMIQTVRAMHAVTVVDLPQGLTLPAAVALEQASVIVAVTQLDPSALAGTKRYLAELEAAGISMAKVRVVYNRVRTHSPLPREQADEVLADYGGGCLTVLPEDEAVEMARARMHPVITEYPDAPWSRALRKLAADLLPGVGLELLAAAASARRGAAGKQRKRFLGLF